MASYNKFEYRRANHEKFNAAVGADSEQPYTVSHYLAEWLSNACYERTDGPSTRVGMESTGRWL